MCKPLFFITLFVMVFFGACTGQKPADLKKETSSRNAVSVSCSSMKLEGGVLTKENILNIFTCSGWNKKYPNLFTKIKDIDQSKIDNVFHSLNKNLILTSKKQNQFFQLISRLESAGELDEFAKFLEKILGQTNITHQFRKFVQAKNLNKIERLAMMKILSSDNEENIKRIVAISSLISSWNKNRLEISGLLDEDDVFLIKKSAIVTIDEVAKGIDVNTWKVVSDLIYNNGSSVKEWSHESLIYGSDTLNDVITSSDFLSDIKNLNYHLDNEIICKNDAGSDLFSVKFKYDLEKKIDLLVSGSDESLRDNLLHSLSIYLAFQNFCKDKRNSKEVVSFFNVINYVNQIMGSSHDKNFISEIHKRLDHDKFGFFRFLESPIFESVAKTLIGLKEKNKESVFVNSLHRIIAMLPVETLKSMSVMLSEFGQNDSVSRSWILAWSKWWPNLSAEEKLEFVELFGLLNSDLDGAKALKVIIELLRNYPELSKDLLSDLSREDFLDDLVYILKIFEEADTQKDLSLFLSNKGIFEFFKLISSTGEKTSENVINRDERNTYADTYVALINSRQVKKNLKESCFGELSENYKKNPSYYYLVNTLPDSCQRSIGQVGFVGQIYLWMFNGNKLFQEKYGVVDFHDAKGVWSVPMLHFIFNLALLSDKNIESKNGQVGLVKNYDEFTNYILSDYPQRIFKDIADLFLFLNPRLNLEDKLQVLISKKNDVEIKKGIHSFLDILDIPKNKSIIGNTDSVDCNLLNSEHGVPNCLSYRYSTMKTIEVMRILKRKNELKNSLLQEIISWVHPSGGVMIPYAGIKSKKVNTSLDEIIRFLMDLSNKKTLKNFKYYHSESAFKNTSGTVIDRLEVIIREIGLLDNFYGAYFLNNVSKAQNYADVIKNSEKLLDWMDKLNGAGRVLFGLPPEVAWKFKTMKETYSSLLDLDYNYLQKEGDSRRYGEFIQSLLTIIVKSSKLSTQDYNPYQKPDLSLVAGHNGIFLTRMVELSILRKMNLFLVTRFKDKSFLEDSRFKQINNNLIGKLDLLFTQNFLQSLLDKYVDNDRNQLIFLVDDIFKLIESNSIDEQKEFEEILGKLLILLSSSQVTKDQLKNSLSYLEFLIKNWPELSAILKNSGAKKYILSNLNNILDVCIEKKLNPFEIIYNIEKEKLITEREISLLLKDQVLREKVSKLLFDLSWKEDYSTKILWVKSLKGVFLNDQISYGPLVSWIKLSILNGERDKLSLSVILKHLSKVERDNKTNFRLILEDIFVNKRNQFQIVLDDILHALQLNPTLKK